MTLKKSIGKLHLWLGLASGLIVLVLSITGCLYVFVDEIKPVVYKERFFVEVPVNAKKLPVGILKEIAQKELGAEYPLSRIIIPGEPDRTYQFQSLKADTKEAITYFGSVDYHYTVYVHPYTGKVVYIENSEYEFFRIVFWIHWSLLLHTDIGQPLVGIAVLVFVIQLITGLILWWPRNKNAIAQRFRFKWKNSTTWKRKNYDLHNVPGFYNLFLALVIALTGLVWAFDWFNDSVQWIANKGRIYEKPQPVFSDTTQKLANLPLDAIVLAEQIRYPHACSWSVNFPANEKAAVRVSVRFDKHSYFGNRNSQYDQYSGKLLKTIGFEDKNAGEKISALNYDIHVGGVLGLPGKILAFIASLICGTLPVTGFYIWKGRRKFDPEKKKVRRSSKTFSIS